MIVTFGGTKGGTGKTTLAVNVAVARAASGRRVLLIDADPQASAAAFAAVRDIGRTGVPFTTVQLKGAAVRTEGARLADTYDDVLIDVAGDDGVGQRAALLLSARVMMPWPPTAVDVWAAGRMDELLAEVRTINTGLDAVAFLNKVEGAGGEAADAAKALADSTAWTFRPDLSIPRRVPIYRAFGEGQAVAERRRAPRDAADAMERLAASAFA